MELDKIKELHQQYKILRKNGMVVNISLETAVGAYNVRNPNVIGKVLALLIRESQKQIESEVKE